jgi:transcriptional regulator with XRE-family HTH domain
MGTVGHFDLASLLRRIRRNADLSQRELAERCGISHSAVAQAESGRRDLGAGVLAQAAALAGLRVALLNESDAEVTGMAADAVRDMSGRRFPAHLDTRYSDEGWWHDAHRYSRRQPWYTFDRDRRGRDANRARDGVPEDHQLPQPGDSPRDRATARRQAYVRHEAAERERRFLAGEFAHLDPGFTCSCPPGCDELDDWSGKPVHCEECTCRCDVG